MAKYQSPAIRSYMIHIFVLMSIYIVALLAAVMAFSADAVSRVAYALTIDPDIQIIGLFRAVMRLLIMVQDEFIKLLHVREYLFATRFCLTIATVWEFLQNFKLVPPGNGGFGAALFWFVGLGFGALFDKSRIGTASGNDA